VRKSAIFLASVQADLVDILTYIAEASGSLAVALGFVRQLRQLRPDIPSVSYRGYVIFFRYVDDRLEVVNILEGHRDIIAYFEDESGPG
jgi:toxin ParE1/3/4